MKPFFLKRRWRVFRWFHQEEAEPRGDVGKIVDKSFSVDETGEGHVGTDKLRRL
jgi:hypothetical protein